MTTPRAAYSRVESMPLNIFSSSAALAAGPPTYTLSPGSPLAAVAFRPETKPLRSLL